MKTKRTRWWLKSAALLCATVFGLTAFGDYWNDWSAGEGAGYWEDSSSWTYGAVADGTLQWRVGYDGAAVKFKTAAAPEAGELHLHGGAATFTADASETDVVNGLTVGVANVGVWYGNAATAEFTSGAYNFTTLNVGRWNNAGTVNINGGTVYAGTIWNGMTNGDTGATTAGSVTLASGELKLGAGGIFSDPAGTFTIAGGTLTATASTEWLVNGTAMVVNGGTINTDYDVTIPSALTGSGTLTKTGTGTLTISGSISAFMGKIAVAAGAGSVIVGDVTIAAGEEVQFGVYTWTGAGTAVEPEEEGGETTYINKDLWSNVNNWLVNNAVPATAPAADSTVVIPEGNGTLTIKVKNGDNTGNLTINRNVKFQRAVDNEGIRFTSVKGEGYTLTLEGGGSKYLAITGSGNPVFDCNLKIENWVRMTGTSVFRVNGSFSGGGTLNAQGNNGEPGFEFAGDTSGFTGSYTGGTRNNGNRDGTQLYGNARGSETGAWSFGGADDYLRCALRVSNTTYYFGSLNTIFGGQNRFSTFIDSKTRLANATLQIGGRANSTSNFGGTLYGTNNKIVKVGDTSTLNVTLTETAGSIEAQAGYVNFYGQNAPAEFTFSGKTAQVYVEKTVGTYGTEEVATGDEDDPETEEDESKTTQETFTAWAPTAYGAYQLVSEDVADENEIVTGKKYYYATVANDAEGTSYYSVEEAFAGVTAKVAENPDFDTTVYMTRSTTEAVVIPVVGYSLSLGDYTVASVIGGAGVTTTYNAETKVWETSENAETWIGANGGLWSEPSNWSGNYTPNDRTIVTFASDAVVYTGTTGRGGEASAVIVNGNVTLQSDATMSTYSNIACYGDITGTGTLTLGRFGIDAGGKAISIDCDIVIENDTAAYAETGHDSWFTNGSFTVNGTTTVNGLLRTYAATVFVGDVVINDGGTVSSIGGTAPTFNNVTMTGKSGINTYAVTYNGALTMGDEAIVSIGSTTQTYGESFVLNGSGTIVANTQLPGSTLQTNLRGNNSNVWTGTCEIKGYTFRECQPANFANNNSTLAFNNVQVGYFRDASYAMGIKICSGGLRLSDQYTYTRTFSGKLSGDGTITTQNGCSMTLLFTGDVSEFAGGITLDSNNATAIVFGSTTTGSGERIVINAGKSVTLASDKTWSAANVIVNGELTVAGTLDVPDGCIWGNTGSDVIKFTNSTTALTIAKFASSWNGTYVVGWNPDSSSTHFVVDNYGRANSKVEIAGVNGAFIALPSTGSAAPTIVTEVILTANWTINNGWTDATTTFAKLSGSGNLTVNGASSGGTKIPYAITTLNEYTGTLGGTRSQFTIGNIVKAGAVVGDLLVNAAADATFVDLDDTTVNGETANVEFKTIDGTPGLYWVEKSDEAISVEGGTISLAADGTITATFAQAVSSADDVVVKVSGSDKSFGNGYGFKVTLAEGGLTATIAPAVTFSESTTAGTAAWSEGEATVTLNIDVVPGMYYAVASGSSLDMARPAATTAATADTVLTIEKQTGDQGFYQVWVSALPITASQE